MWPAEAAVLYVAVGAQRVEWGVLKRGQWVPALSGKLLIQASQGTTPVVAAIDEALRAIEANHALLEAVSQVRVMLSDRWVAQAALPWSADLLDADRADAFVRRQLAASGFDVLGQDAVRLDDAPFGQPRWAVAYPAAILGALHRLAAAAGAQLETVLTCSAAAWSAQQGERHKGLRAIGVIDDEFGVLLHGHRRLGAVVCRGLAAEEEPHNAEAALRAHWLRMRLRDVSLQAVDALDVLDLAASELHPWLQDKSTHKVSGQLSLATVAARRRCALDAISPTIHWTKVKAATLVLAAALTASLVIHAAWSLQADQVQQAQLQEELNAQARQSQAKSRSAPSRDELARTQAVNVAIRELNAPWGDVLISLEPPADIRIAILSVEWVGARERGAAAPDLKIVGQAQSAYDMTRYAAFLSDRKALRAARLVQHERVATGAEALRFRLEATWSD